MKARWRYRFRGWEFDVDQQTVTRLSTGERLQLQPQPGRVLDLLLSRPGEILHWTELAGDGRGGTPSRRSLSSCIYRLRQILDVPGSEESLETSLIEALSNGGYRLAAPVERLPVHPVVAIPEFTCRSSRETDQDLAHLLRDALLSELVALAEDGVRLVVGSQEPAEQEESAEITFSLEVRLGRMDDELFCVAHLVHEPERLLVWSLPCHPDDRLARQAWVSEVLSQVRAELLGENPPGPRSGP